MRKETRRVKERIREGGEKSKNQHREIEREISRRGAE